MLLIYTVKSGKSLGSDKGKKKNLRKKYEIHFPLRYGYIVTVNQIVLTFDLIMYRKCQWSRNGLSRKFVLLFYNCEKSLKIPYGIVCTKFDIRQPMDTSLTGKFYITVQDFLSPVYSGSHDMHMIKELTEGQRVWFINGNNWSRFIVKKQTWTQNKQVQIIAYLCIFLL